MAPILKNRDDDEDEEIKEPASSPAVTHMREKVMVRRLECPFTWDNIIVFDTENTNYMIDRLPLALSPWDGIIQRCHLAYSEFRRNNIPRSSQFIVECYIPLLKVPGLVDTSCDLIKENRHALKHVIDATFAFIRLHDAHDDETCRLLSSFVACIPQVNISNNKQQAAINAIRSKCTSSHPERRLYAHAAMALDPDERKWSFYLSKVIYDGMRMYPKIVMVGWEEPLGGGAVPREKQNDLLMKIEIALNSTWDSPEHFLLLANMIHITHVSRTNLLVQKANLCVRKALDRFPNNAYVQEQSADILVKCTPLYELLRTDFKRVQRFYMEALRLAGKEILTVRYKLGLLQVLYAGQLKKDNGKMLAEGQKNLKMARFLSAETMSHYMLAMDGKLTLSAIVGVGFVYVCFAQVEVPRTVDDNV